jgi:hypothetical protein
MSICWRRRGDKSGGLYAASTFCLRLLFNVFDMCVIVVAVVADKLPKLSSSSSTRLSSSSLFNAGSENFNSFFWFSLALFPGCYITEHRACISIHRSFVVFGPQFLFSSVRKMGAV